MHLKAGRVDRRAFLEKLHCGVHVVHDYQGLAQHIEIQQLRSKKNMSQCGSTGEQPEPDGEYNAIYTILLSEDTSIISLLTARLRSRVPHGTAFTQA